MFTQRVLSIVVSLTFLLLSGCKIETPPLTITVSGNTGNTASTSSQLSCAVQVQDSYIIAGETVPILLQVTGGTAPYTFSGLLNSFNSQVTVSDIFANNGTTSSQVTRTYSISDNSGNSASCQLSVTVYPIPPVSNLACAFSVDDSTPSMGELVNFTVTVSGGTAPYNSSQYTPGTNTNFSSGLTSSSSTTFSSSANYSVAGLKTASVIISDSAGAQTTCSQVLNVISAPSVTVTASPSASVPAGTSITLSATTANFGVSPEITFSTTSGGVTFSAVGSSIVVSTVDTFSRTVVVDVMASTATQQATTSITLNFTSSQTLNCSLTHASGYYRAGESVRFSVSATTGEVLSLTSLSAQDGTIIDSLGGSSARIRFSSSGYKNVSATARALYSDGTFRNCNGGATLTNSIYIYSAPVNLSCTAITSPNYSYPGNLFLVKAQVPSGSGVGTVSLTQIQTSWDAITSYSYHNDATSSYMAIYNTGIFPIVLTVRDEAGNTATCSTFHTVY